MLLSCRMLGRRIEDVLLHVLAERARERGARYLVGRYLPTAKNTQVASFYPQHGFEAVGDGVFRLDLARQSVDPPPHTAVRMLAGA
jgi:predicted enzyme involved in methoxymalonyl-ACP biosynthesis